MGNDIRVQQPNATSLYDALVFKTDKTTAPVQEETQQEEEIQTQDTSETEQPTKGRVPANNVSFDEPVIEQDPTENQESDLPSIEDLQRGPNRPVSDDNGELPSMDDLENSQKPADNPDDYKPETSKEHSVDKAVMHMWSGLANKVIPGIATKYITKTTASAVTKELTEVVGKAVVGKTAAKVGADLAGKVTAGATKGLTKTIADLTVKGALGKGVATVGVKEGALAAGSLVKGLEASTKATGEILLQGGVKKILPNTLNALSKTSIGAGEKVLQTGLEKGTQIAVKQVLKNVGAEGVETAGKVVVEAVAKSAAKTTAKTAAKTGVKIATKTAAKTGSKTVTKATTSALEKATSEAVTKATTEVAAKGGVKFATKVGKAMPYIGAAIGIGITAWDTKDAIDKQKDKNASTVSKVLAWTTVGLDVVSTASTATGKGKPLGWAATGLSIGTSVLSDYTR